MTNLENLENLEVAVFSRFSGETWKTWKTGHFQVYLGSDSKRAYAEARVIGIPYGDRYLYPEEVFQVYFQVSAKNQTAANALRAPLFSLLLDEENTAC